MSTCKIRVGIVVLLALAPLLAYGQPNNPPGAPIHGLALLLVAGISYGILSLRKKKNQ